MVYFFQQIYIKQSFTIKLKSFISQTRLSQTQSFQKGMRSVQNQLCSMSHDLSRLSKVPDLSINNGHIDVCAGQVRITQQLPFNSLRGSLNGLETSQALPSCSSGILSSDNILDLICRIIVAFQQRNRGQVKNQLGQTHEAIFELQTLLTFNIEYLCSLYLTPYSSVEEFLIYCLLQVTFQHQINKMEADSWTKTGLRPNVVYLIKNPLSGRFLRANDSEAEQVEPFISLRGPDYHGEWLYWYFEGNSDGTCVIRNTLSQRFLRGGDSQDEQMPLTLAKRGLEYHGDWIHWRIESLGGDKYTIQNPLGGRYLRGGNNNDEYMAPTAAKRGLDYHGDWLIWTITPASSTFKVRLTSFDFEHQEDIIKNSGGKIKRASVGQNTLTVAGEKLGSEISQTFTKTFTQSYNYTFSQTFGITASLEFQAKIPFVGSLTTKVETKAEWGTSKNWGTQTSSEISINVKMNPTQPGDYRMFGWVDIVENIEIPYRARGTFTANGLGFKNGKLENTHTLSGDYIEGLMRASDDYKSLNVLAKTETSLTVEVTGIMIGTYGVKSNFTTERIK